MKSALDTLKTTLANNTFYMKGEVTALTDLEEQVVEKKAVITAYENSIEDIKKAIKIMEAVQ